MGLQANILPNSIHRKHLAFVDNNAVVRTEQPTTSPADFRVLVSGADTQADYVHNKFVDSQMTLLGVFNVQKVTGVGGVQTMRIGLTLRDNLTNDHVLKVVAGVPTWGLVPKEHDAVSLGAANGLSLANQVLSLALATTTTAGAMSASDKVKLNGIEANANNYVHPISGVTVGTYGSSTSVAQVSVNAQGHITSASSVAITFPSHTHAIADVTGLQTILDSKSNNGHTHSISDVSGLQGVLDTKASTTHTHAIGDVTGLQTALNGKANTTHTHAIGDVTGLQTALNGKADTTHLHTGVYAPVSHTHTRSDIVDFAHTHNEYVVSSGGYGEPLINTASGVTNRLKSLAVNAFSPLLKFDVYNDTIEIAGKASPANYGKYYSAYATWEQVQWGEVGNKPTVFAPSAHTHEIADVNGLSGALSGKANTTHTHSTSDVTGLDAALSGKASTTHTHNISDVSGLQTALDNKTNLSHTHSEYVLSSSGFGTSLIRQGNQLRSITINGGSPLLKLVEYTDGGGLVSTLEIAAKTDDTSNHTKFYRGDGTFQTIQGLTAGNVSTSNNNVTNTFIQASDTVKNTFGSTLYFNSVVEVIISGVTYYLPASRA